MTRSMKWIGGLGILAALISARPAQAQQFEEAAPPPGRDAPRERVGFQLALRTGYAIPMGKVAGGESELKLADFTSGQVPIFVDIGGKVIPNLFIGGYLGLAFGGAGGTQADFCDAANADCVSVNVRVGAEIQYHILPDQLTNPWLGYGIGIESVAVGASAGGEDTTLGFVGFEFAHFMGGVDFRLSRVFGLGPFVDFSIGQYDQFRIESSDGPDSDGDIEDTALHQWLILGLRGVFFP
jgi:hypothetical protein